MDRGKLYDPAGSTDRGRLHHCGGQHRQGRGTGGERLLSEAPDDGHRQTGAPGMSTGVGQMSESATDQWKDSGFGRNAGVKQ